MKTSRLWGAIGALILSILSGCASLSKDSGFEVQPKSALKNRQEGWHNVTLQGDIRKTQALTVAFVHLQQPLSTRWRAELVDQGRTYTVKLPDGRQLKKPLERVVERALCYTEDGRLISMFDADLEPTVLGFYVLMPPDQKKELCPNLVIVPSDASWLLTTRSVVVPLQEGQELTQLPSGFFREHPSPLPLRHMALRSRQDEDGKKFLSYLERKYPFHFSVGGVPYSGRPDADIVLAEFTSLDTPLDKVISCGTLSVSPGLITVGLAVSMIRNGYVASQKDCLNGTRNEPKPAALKPQEADL